MKRSLVLYAATLLTPLNVTAEEAASTAAGSYPPTADSAVELPLVNPGSGNSPRGTAGHHRHGMKHGKGKQGHGAGHGGKRHEFHRQLINRLDLMDARLSKIEAMLEKLLQR